MVRVKDDGVWLNEELSNLGFSVLGVKEWREISNYDCLFSTLSPVFLYFFKIGYSFDVETFPNER